MKYIILPILIAFSINAFAQKSSEQLVADGKNFLEAKEFKLALLNFTQAVEKDKNNELAYFYRGITKKEFDDKHGAMKDFNMALDLDETMVSAYFYRGSIKYDLQDYYGAISDYNKALELDGSYTDALYKRGMAKQQLEAYSDAINDCTEIIKINPKSVDAYYLRGILRIEHGQLEEGCLDLSKAGELGDISAYDVIREKCNQRCLTVNP
ncbi:MAG: tetratricopeptide repeat protein [Cyclobacteriaceae bacterium]|nr:tetratricopeptide repeat protein [Cyclobacteriaceae bacterium]MCH8515215.1 tetratricopeptide repeat protein [Cyclobacteriaceae bacterium]